MALEVTFVVVGGETKTTEVKLRLPTIIGRGKTSGIMVPHPLVSRQHCEIYEQDGRLMVRDLGSLNGTFVGQEKVTDGVLLPEQLLTVGNVTFRAVYSLSAAAAAMPQAPTKSHETPVGVVIEEPATGNKTVPAPKNAVPPAAKPVAASSGNIDFDPPTEDAEADGDDSSLDFAAFLKSLEDGK